ncbi:hypothetical protein [Tenacibaculum maritimum]|uniref:Uncharacterized protein n=2 Tax=Tenacibaculum maritimum TaxID=107401 RepID=A0A2H1ED13_9FLAO|nr:hypothetical protein [Tenacibaculum maritimum]MDB0601447.1 hypothetical protein [Tenacibaculum maritimum]MDB0613009.1 hypothetical protein [Tenacibaculum maritimum]CAA0150062.1 conserved hypothetical protein [Tenacibaculum maritimum]CAA0178858.1 conserved hypothetical protein [Tenacibaculum maritimum]CAA0226985.1 conserved hypothetical protein [Tenacibaculum maritimum]
MDNFDTIIEKGKTRGYSETCIKDNQEYICEYAIRKKDGKYIGYYFKILSHKMDQYEDYAHEEYKNFETVIDAVNFIQKKGGNIDLFKPMKGNSII